jgi:hypothetical protein
MMIINSDRSLIYRCNKTGATEAIATCTPNLPGYSSCLSHFFSSPFVSSGPNKFPDDLDSLLKTLPLMLLASLTNSLVVGKFFGDINLCILWVAGGHSFLLSWQFREI